MQRNYNARKNHYRPRELVYKTCLWEQNLNWCLLNLETENLNYNKKNTFHKAYLVGNEPFMAWSSYRSGIYQMTSKKRLNSGLISMDKAFPFWNLHSIFNIMCQFENKYLVVLHKKILFATTCIKHSLHI